MIFLWHFKFYSSDIYAMCMLLTLSCSLIITVQPSVERKNVLIQTRWNACVTTRIDLCLKSHQTDWTMRYKSFRFSNDKKKLHVCAFTVRIALNSVAMAITTSLRKIRIILSIRIVLKFVFWNLKVIRKKVSLTNRTRSKDWFFFRFWICSS